MAHGFHGQDPPSLERTTGVKEPTVLTTAAHLAHVPRRGPGQLLASFLAATTRAGGSDTNLSPVCAFMIQRHLIFLAVCARNSLHHAV